MTHPHEDHYKGVDEIIKMYPGGVKRVCWYSGDGIHELKKYICQQRVAGRTVLPGFPEVLNTMQDSPKNGCQTRQLSELTTIAETPLSKLIALSPSSSNIKMYVEKLFKAIPVVGEPVRPMNDNEHNLISTALFLKFGKLQAIFGSDLENTDDKSSGWNAIVYNNDCPELWANFIKIAHHGSINGYNSKVWEEHCKYNKPVAAITPFLNGNIYLPDSDLINILKDKVSKLYLTSFPKYQTKINRYYKKDIEKSIVSRTRNFKIIEYPDKAGFVRFRFSSEGELLENITVPPAAMLKSTA